MRYTSLRRERLTGLLVCTPASGRAVRACWDPWPAVYDFQAYPDKSIEPPPEPLPLRYNLDNIWGNAAAPAPAPDDATRLNNLVALVPYYANIGKSAAFMAPSPPVWAAVKNLTTIIPADYDGTFIPSGSIRTVTPPDEGAELAAVNATDVDAPTQNGDFNSDFNSDFDTDAPLVIWSPPWAAVIKV